MSKSQPIQQTQTQQNTIPPWLTQGSKTAVSQGENLPQWSGPYGGTNPYANLTPEQLQAMGLASSTAGAPAGLIGQAVPGASALMGFQAPQISAGGVNAATQQYMNPYIQSVIDASNRQLDVNAAQAMNAMDNSLAQQHAFGGDRQAIADAAIQNQGDITKAQTLSQLYSGGYGQALQSAMQQAAANQAAGIQGAGIQQGAVNSLGGLAQLLSGANTSGISNLLQAGGVGQQTGTNQGLFNYQNQFLNQFQIPEQILQAFAGALGSLPHNTLQQGTTTGTAYSNPWLGAMGLGSLLQGAGGISGITSGIGGLGTALGLGGSAAGAGGIGPGVSEALPAFLGVFSDRRLKRDVEKIGQLADGTPFYRFRYLGDDTPRVGLMSDEVDPAAVHKHPSGYDTVDYGKATERAAQINAFRGMIDA